MIQSGSVEAYYENGKQLKDGKGKSKICNLSRHGRDQFQERLDFKFSDFQALEVFLQLSISLSIKKVPGYILIILLSLLLFLQIEKGWNNLFVSIISIETGETIAKSGKATVQNGECCWEDSILSTIWISDDSL